MKYFVKGQAGFTCALIRRRTVSSGIGRCLSSLGLGVAPPALVRNVGVVSHIDAGKTTTTERMLFYAGKVQRMGEVDGGTTTTDFMPEEMERGITISAAAVSFEWKQHMINLIDTPGHADFVIEVQRCLRVLDGVVALFDGAVGVQAQSYTVLREARRCHTPLIAFMNKLDKTTANFSKALQSLTKLRVKAVPIQLPLLRDDGGLDGVCDIVRWKALRFQGEHGRDVLENDLSEEAKCVTDEAAAWRHSLLSEVTRRDEGLAESLIGALDRCSGDERKAEFSLPPNEIIAAIRRQTIAQSEQGDMLPFVPVLCGASRRNCGVQPLLDAVTQYLPSPVDRPPLRALNAQGVEVEVPPPASSFNSVLALAFKVMHVPNKKGLVAPIVLLRIYCGKLTKGSKLVNRSKGNCTVVVDQLYVMQADNNVPVDCLIGGHIGAAFMDNVSTGDTLATAPSQDSSNSDIVTFESIVPPPAVMSHAIEPHRLAQVDALKEALQRMQKEDVSLRVEQNEHNQVVVAGMGELHFEILVSRLEREYGIGCDLTRAYIAYRESVVGAHKVTDLVVHNSDGAPVLRCSAELTSMVDPESCQLDAAAQNTVTFSEDATAQYLARVRKMVVTAGATGKMQNKADKVIHAEWHNIQSTATRVFSQVCSVSPVHKLPLSGLRVTITAIDKHRSEQLTNEDASAAFLELFRALLQQVSCTDVMEPIMAAWVCLSEAQYAGDVMRSFNERNASTVELLDDGMCVHALVPLRNIARYSSHLRQITKGNGHFWTQLAFYQKVANAASLERILKVNQ